MSKGKYYVNFTTGYRLSNMCITYDQPYTLANWIALFACIVAGMSSDKALTAMGIKAPIPFQKRRPKGAVVS